MGHMKRVSRILVLALVLSVLLALGAAADTTAAVWLNTQTDSGNTGICVCANTAVTDGLIKLTYDSDALTFEDVTVSSDYVAVYAVNADEEGIVKISWVAPGAYEVEDSHVLMQVNFTGTSDESVILSGTVCTADGKNVSIMELDLTTLEAAIAEAEVINKDSYTSESYAAVQSALAEAKAVLADATATQAEVDAAADKLSDAVNALVTAGTGSETQNKEDDTANSTTGDETPIGLWIGLMALCAVGIVVVLTIMKKRGNDK